MMNVMSTMERGRDALFTRGAELARRSTLLGLDLLGRVEQRTSSARENLSARRESLNGAPAERLERRVLSRLESLLELLSKGAANQRKRLAADASPDISDAVLVEDTKAGSRPRARAASKAPASKAPASASKARASKASASKAPAASKSRAPKASAKPKKASAKAAKAAPSRESTRWVSEPADELGALTELNAKELIARASSLPAATRKALAAHEKANKQRKTVLAALDA